MNVHENSFKSVQIELLSQETKAHMGYASGFICSFKEKFFLVTNFHVVSGKNFENKKILHPSGATPGFFNLTFQVAKNKTENTTEFATCTINQLPLYDYLIEEGKLINGENKLWVEHPEKGSDIDIAVLDISNEIIKEKEVETFAYIIEKEISEEIPYGVMDEVFIIGYPLKSTTTPNSFPIHKGATIASEPDIYKSLPMFYVDGKTKKGMSGSPVTKREKLKISEDKINLKFIQDTVRLIGIYSGRERQVKDEYEAELGIVWRLKECIVPILEEAVKLDTSNKSLSGIIREIARNAKSKK